MDDKDKKGEKQEQEQFSKFKLTITHRDVKEIETVCRNILENIEKVNEEASKEQSRAALKHRGPVRIPTKHLRLTVRKSPCGNGTATFDRYEMRIHKRVFYLDCTRNDIKSLTNINIPPGMIVEAIETEE